MNTYILINLENYFDGADACWAKQTSFFMVPWTLVGKEAAALNKKENKKEKANNLAKKPLNYRLMFEKKIRIH